MKDQGIILGTKIINCIYCGNNQMIPEETDFRFEIINCNDCKKIISKEIHLLVELPEFDMTVNFMFMGDPNIPELNEERIKSLVDLTDHNLKEWDDEIQLDANLLKLRKIEVYTLHMKVLTNAKKNPFEFRLEAVGIMAGIKPKKIIGIKIKDDLAQVDYDGQSHFFRLQMKKSKKKKGD